MMENIYIGDKTLEELECLFSCNIENDDDDVLAYNLKQNSPGYLVEHIDDFSGKRKRAAIFGLGFTTNRDSLVIDKLTSLISCDDEFLISESIDSLIRLDVGSMWEELHPLLGNSSPYVRDTVLRYARYSLGAKASKILISALDDEHYIVRENAIDELSELGNASAINEIKPLLNDSHPDVCMAASSAIEELSNIE